jgi:hypothetical protein
MKRNKIGLPICNQRNYYYYNDFIYNQDNNYMCRYKDILGSYTLFGFYLFKFNKK